MNELRESIAIFASFAGGAELRNQLRGWVDMALDIGNNAGSASEFERVESLQIEPEFRIGFEVAGQTCVRGNAAALVNNFANASCRYMEIDGQLIDGQAQRLHEVFEENLSGMNRRKQLCSFSHGDCSHLLVIVHDFHVVTMAIPPYKTDSPLVVNPDGMLAFAAAT
jgi:hypothetical protein